MFFADILKNSQRVLQTFLPDLILFYNINLERRSHNKIVLCKTVGSNGRDIIVRVLYKDSY